MMRLGRFLADGISTVRVSTLHLTALPVRTAERRVAWAGKWTGSVVLSVWASRGKYGQIWSVLSIMSRWKWLDQITNLELITSGGWYLLYPLSHSALSSLWWFLSPSVCLSQGSSSFSPQHHTGCFINSVLPDYTPSASQCALIGI